MTLMVSIITASLFVLTVHAEYDGEPEEYETTQTLPQFMPVVPFAQSASLPLNPPANIAPTTVFAEIQGNMLRVDVLNGFFNVEAIYVNGRRFNHRVDAALLIDVTDYLIRNDTIQVHAVDFAGNPSATVFVSPPLPPEQIYIPTITPPGQATATDIIMGARGIEFFTFTTPAGNVFHMIVDPVRGTNNVYLLSAVTEWDLVSFAQMAEIPNPNNVTASASMPTPILPEIPEIPVPPAPPATAPALPEAPIEAPYQIPEETEEAGQQEPTAEETQPTGGINLIGLLIIPLLIGGGIFGFLQWKKMKKQKEAAARQSQEDDDETEYTAEENEEEYLDDDEDEITEEETDISWKDDKRNYEVHETLTLRI